LKGGGGIFYYRFSGGIVYYSFTTNSLASLSVKEFWKSVSICGKNSGNNRVAPFFRTWCTTTFTATCCRKPKHYWASAITATHVYYHCWRKGEGEGEGESIWALYRGLWKNGWTDRDAAWGEDSSGPKEARIRWESRSLTVRGTFDRSHRNLLYGAFWRCSRVRL